MATRVKVKAARRAENAEKRPHARVTHVRIAPNKVRIVIDLVRGKPVDAALSILQYTPKAASPVVSKLIKSAVANAENNLEMDPKTLYVAEIYADQGPQAKRWRPRSRGMANPFLKRSSHISVVLDTIASDQAEEASN